MTNEDAIKAIAKRRMPFEMLDYVILIGAIVITVGYALYFFLAKISSHNLIIWYLTLGLILIVWNLYGKRLTPYTSSEPVDRKGRIAYQAASDMNGTNPEMGDNYLIFYIEGDFGTNPSRIAILYDESGYYISSVFSGRVRFLRGGNSSRVKAIVKRIEQLELYRSI